MSVEVFQTGQQQVQRPWGGGSQGPGWSSELSAGEVQKNSQRDN